MMTSEQYRESLRDGRTTYLDGKRVPDVAQEPLLAEAINWIADGYAQFYSPTRFTPCGRRPGQSRNCASA
jgi:aromatic ring hydroxylase